MVGRYQPVTLRPMEGRFESGPGAGLAMIGQPNVAAKRLDNPIEMPGLLSFLAHGQLPRRGAGARRLPARHLADNIELLYTPSTSWPGSGRSSSS